MKTAPDYVNYEGYAILYGFERDRARQGVDAVEMLRDAGLSLAVPGSPGRVRVLDETCENRRDVPVAEFQEMLRCAPFLWFKAWTHKGSDLLCALQRKDGWWCEYYVIGYLQESAEPLVEKLVERFVDEAHGDREHLLIVDWQYSAVEEVVWDEVWEKAAVYGGESLEVMGIPERLASQFNGPLTGDIDEPLPGHRLLITLARES